MKEIIKKYNISAKKSLGQNFLIDDKVLDKIIASMNIDSNTSVIEIGPGYGAVTKKYYKDAKKVVCYEIDSSLCEVLKKEFKNDVVVVNEDFLKINIEEEIKKHFEKERIIVLSNLPYYITTPIIFKLLEKDYGFSDFYFMMQKEVGDRFTGKPKTKDYNALSVVMSYKTNVEELFKVGRNSFFPVPNVDSSFLHLEYRKIDYKLKNEANFLKFIKAIFSMRRKTLINNIVANYNINKDKVEHVLSSCNYKLNVRSEELTLDDIYNIYQMLFEDD